IYLSGYEIAVRDGNLISIMTTYGMVNGTFTAGNYDLNTAILRGQWGYGGLVMTDWWACFSVNDKGEPDRNDLAAMVRAQNDLAMVREDTLKENGNDNLLESLKSGAVTRAELHRCAKNILNVIMRTPALDRWLGRLHEEEIAASKEAEADFKMGIVWESNEDN
ncbi:MAG: beta-glucosidase, partial [Oscillospiraceae bacterium]|nr:beta-glucosidase [Oscillospiraceae bacterium]